MKLTQIEIAQLCRNLALLLRGGIGTADGVFLLAQEAEGRLRTLLEALGAGLDAGENLSEAMARSGAFPACVTGMVHTGERTGRLEEVLEALAQFYDQRSRANRAIKNAVTYPAVLLALMLVVIGVLLVRVLPVFEQVYASLGSGLSGVAKDLLQLGRWLAGAMPALAALLGLAALAALLYGCCEKVRRNVNAWWTARFGDRGAAGKYNNANFARALAMGLGSALPLEEAVEQAGRLLEDVPAAAERCRRCAELLRGGTALPEAMKETGFLPPAESRMLVVGLTQGSGDRVMEHIAQRLMEQADEELEDTVAKIEPAMVLTASVLVGMILLAVMLPLMNIMAAIG